MISTILGEMIFKNGMRKNLVSVLLPVRNGQEHLACAIDSLVSQTYNNFEIIAVDHNSTDDTPNILERYANAESRVKTYRFEGESFVDCLNYGLSHCRGEFIARMDADDICRNDRLAKQSEFLERNLDIGIVGSAVKIFGSEGVGEGYRRYEKWINSLTAPEDIAREIFVESPLPHPSVMMRRGVIGKLGGYHDFGWPEDYDLWLRAWFAGVRMAKLPEQLLEWRDHSGRLSRVSERYSRKNFHRLRAYYLTKFLRGKKIVIQGAGTTGRWIGKFMKSYGADLSAYLDINPRKIGGRKLGLPVFSADCMSDFRGSFLLAAVSSWGARELIREEAKKAGFTEGVDFLCAS